MGKLAIECVSIHVLSQVMERVTAPWAVGGSHSISERRALTAGAVGGERANNGGQHSVVKYLSLLYRARSYYMVFNCSVNHSISYN